MNAVLGILRKHQHILASLNRHTHQTELLIGQLIKMLWPGSHRNLTLCRVSLWLYELPPKTRCPLVYKAKGSERALAARRSPSLPPELTPFMKSCRLGPDLLSEPLTCAALCSRAPVSWEHSFTGWSRLPREGTALCTW